MSPTLRVGITGGIGSGKSALTDHLAAHGVAIVDADRAARDVVAPGEAALDAIACRFGEGILRDDGTLDRAALRRIVFTDPDARRWLESLTHPLIGARLQAGLAQARSAYAVLSSPLLLEGRQRELVDVVVVVDAPEEVQLARTVQRDKHDAALVRAIMAAQMDRQQRLTLADRVIDNSGTRAALQRTAASLHSDLTALAALAARPGGGA